MLQRRRVTLCTLWMLLLPLLLPPMVARSWPPVCWQPQTCAVVACHGVMVREFLRPLQPSLLAGSVCCLSHIQW
jgi:hypothetical protein